MTETSASSFGHLNLRACFEFRYSDFELSSMQMYLFNVSRMLQKYEELRGG